MDEFSEEYEISKEEACKLNHDIGGSTQVLTPTQDG
jgi:hypothetical protein